MIDQGLKLLLEGAESFIRGVNDADDAQRKLGKSSEETADRSNRAAGLMGNAFKAMAAAVAVAAVAATAAVVKFGIDSLQVAADFNDGMRTFESVVGNALQASGHGIDDFRKKALQLGQDTRFGADEALDAMTNLARGGVKPEQILGGATDAVLNLAAAAKYDLANAADIVAAQLGVWSDEGVTAAQIADTFAQVANATVSTVDDLRLALAQGGSAAQQIGLDFRDTSLAMGLIRKGFASGSDAGTSFKTLLQSLVPKSDAALAAMVKLGLATNDGKSAFFDAQGAFIGLEAAAGLLKSALGDLSDEQLIAATTTLFGTDASRAAAQLAKEGAEGVRAARKEMDLVGTAAEQAAKMNQGWNYVMDQISGTITTLQINVGTFLEKALLPMAEGVLRVVNDFSDFVGALIEGKTTIQDIAASLLGPILAFQGLGDIAKEYGDTVSRAFTLVDSIVRVMLGNVTAFVQNHGDDIEKFFSQAWDTVISIIHKAIELYQITVLPNLEKVLRFLGTHGEEIQRIFEGMWNFVSGVVGTALTFIENLFNVFIAKQKGDGAALDLAWRQLFTDLWEGVKKIVEGALIALAGIIDLGLKAIGIDIDQGTANAKASFKKMGEDIQAGVNKFLTDLTIDVTRLGVQLYNEFVLPVENALLYIQSVYGQFVQAGNNIVKGISDGVLSAGSILYNAVVDLINGVLSNATNGINAFIQGIGATVQSLTGSNPLSGAMIAAPQLPRAQGGTMNNVTNYNLNVTSRQSLGSIQTDFAVMQAMSR